VKNEVPFTREQIEGIEALLLHNWEQERGQEGPPRPTIQLSEIQRQEWGKGLSPGEALKLLQAALFTGGWYVQDQRGIRSAQGIQGYQYTDAESAASTRDYYPFHV